MSKSKKIQKNINDVIKKALSSQQNLLFEKYEKLNNDIDNKNLISLKNANDYHYEILYSINNNNIKELPQYSALYLKRLEYTKNKLLDDCKKKWPKIHICKNILDLKGNVIIFFYNFYFRKNKLSLASHIKK